MMNSKADALAPIHPGVILKAEFLEPLGMSQYRLAKALGVPQVRISQIVRGQRAITADTALRLAACFGNSAEFWLGLQMQYDLEVAADDVGEEISREVQPCSA